jgi:hypothetical protein
MFGYGGDIWLWFLSRQRGLVDNLTRLEQGGEDNYAILYVQI